jgi:hypothetical protein
LLTADDFGRQSAGKDDAELPVLMSYQLGLLAPVRFGADTSTTPLCR